MMQNESFSKINRDKVKNQNRIEKNIHETNKGSQSIWIRSLMRTMNRRYDVTIEIESAFGRGRKDTRFLSPPFVKINTSRNVSASINSLHNFDGQK